MEIILQRTQTRRQDEYMESLERLMSHCFVTQEEQAKTKQKIQKMLFLYSVSLPDVSDGSYTFRKHCILNLRIV